ncbi:MAG TPA: hypothetical protein DCE23_05840 [Firmicutes bacterium]|nr:hypothetical protein [Bacillota bacterium]
MNFMEAEKQANNLKVYAESLVSQYKIIISCLNNLNHIIVNKDSNLARRINELVGKYDEMISVVSNSYKDSSNRILDYVDSSRHNLDELTANVAHTTREFEQKQGIVDTTCGFIERN